MGSVELLSREGEIAIAKRVEAGREAMIAGLCASPLTFQAIIIWRDELNEGKVFLRDIIDLEATYAGPDAKATPAPVIGLDGQLIVGIAVPGQPGRPPQMQAPATAPAAATPFKPVGKRSDGEGTTADGMVGESNLNDDDDMENWVTVAAIEAELKPKVIETSDPLMIQWGADASRDNGHRPTVGRRSRFMSIVTWNHSAADSRPIKERTAAEK